MKILKIAVVVVILIALATALGFAFTIKHNKIPDAVPDTCDALLHADGKHLKNANGDIVPLRGVNLGGWLVQESWLCVTECEDYFSVLDALDERFGSLKAEELVDIYEDNYISQTDIELLADMGVNCVRVPFTWRNLQNTDLTYKDDAFKRLDWIISECSARNIYVILDLHGAHGSQNGRDHSGTVNGGQLYSSPENMTETIKLWETIAARYKNEQYLAGYDLLNEPEGKPGGQMTYTQLRYYNRLYKAIRKVDGNHVIIMEAIWDPDVMPDPAIYDWENVMYEYHYYGWDCGSNSARTIAFTKSKADILANSNGANVPCLVGEFSLFQLRTAWDFALNFYNQNGWSWTMWNYKTDSENSLGALYKGDNERVDYLKDSYEQIAEKWAAVNTKNYAPTTWLVDIVSKYCKQ